MPKPRLSKNAKRWRQLIASLRAWDGRNLLRIVVLSGYSIAIFPEDITSRTNEQVRALLLERLGARPKLSNKR